jgi:hypothetical protein
VFNVPDPHPIAFPACDSNTHEPRDLTLCMCLSLSAHLRDIHASQAVKGVIDSYDALVDLLESIEHFLNRLDIYTKIPPTVAMTEMVVKILAVLLSTLALATKQVKQGKPSESVFGEVLYNLTQCNAEKFIKKLLGEKDVEVVLQRLDRLTHDEARITAVQTLEVVYRLVQNVRVVMDGEQIDSACRPLGVDDPPSRWQGIGRTCQGCPWYVLRASIKRLCV